MLQLLIPVIGTLIDKIIPDPQAAAQAKLRMFELQQQGALAEADRELKIALSQAEINKIEAASENLYKSGWRPAVGWICASALAYQMIVRPLFGWAATNWLGWNVPPALELDTLLTLLFGLLGLGAYRTVEKVKGAA